MYTQFFGLREKPFAITPDPRYLYLSQPHADALAHLMYGVSHSGGFIQLTGEVGTGKTTLVRTLFEQMPDEADVALILNPEISRAVFLTTILEELKLDLPSERSSKALIDRLNRHLLEAHSQGRRTVVIVDEAQNLSPAILEQVRLLTNLETPTQKLLQIILIGQPELRDLLAKRGMRQVAQRITGRYHLEPLSEEDTVKYLEHRLKVAGASGGIFTPNAMREIYRQSDGVPRLINVIADRALLAAYTQDTRLIDRPLIRHAAAEVYGQPRSAAWKAHLAATTTVIALAALAFATWYYATLGAPGVVDPAIDQATIDVVEPVTAITPDPDAAAQPSSLSLAGMLANAVLPTDTDAAFETLFEFWGASYDSSSGPACEQALEQGLRCWFERGTVGHLRRLNRPAILSLIDANGDEHHAVLGRLDETSGTLFAGKQTYMLTLEELTENWYGDHLILWRPGNGFGDTISPGSQSDGVLWLRESLAKIYGEPAPVVPSDYYDSALGERVRAYQREHRLTVDGIVGTQTQIAINTELGVPGTPLLAEAG
ncbi:MAG: AAA family ATPase [Gammaproteobacteria bacterium]|nr:AAA family ATPase [Gammaproteobacteria bacterium]